MKKAIDGVAIKDRKILLVRKRQAWILPGGKPKKDESDIECLSREISEEILGTKFQIKDYYGSFTGETPHKKYILTAKVYFIDVSEVGNPAREIAEVRWFSRDETNEYNISDITKKVICQLKEDNYF